MGVLIVLFYLVLISAANLALGFALATYLNRRGLAAAGSTDTLTTSRDATEFTEP